MIPAGNDNGPLPLSNGNMYLTWKQRRGNLQASPRREMTDYTQYLYQGYATNLR